MPNKINIPQLLARVAVVLNEGEIYVFGSAALHYSVGVTHPVFSQDVDIWVEPESESDKIECLMGELSDYHEKHDEFVEVWRPETFAAPEDWLDRATIMTTEEIMSAEDFPAALMPRDVTLFCPHPWDILFAKMERWERKDQEHARLILETFPISERYINLLDSKMPYRTGKISNERRIAAYVSHFSEFCGWEQVSRLFK